jgi:hypothetical protein
VLKVYVNDAIGNGTGDLPACSPMHQRTAPPLAPVPAHSTVILPTQWATVFTVLCGWST